MGRREDIRKRFTWIKRLFITLFFVIITFSILRETHMFYSSVKYFEDELLEYRKSEVISGVSNRQDEIEAIKASLEIDFYDELLDNVQLINYFAQENVNELPEDATLEEKRNIYIDTLYQYDILEDKYLFFSLDLNGESWLMGLDKSVEHNDLTYLQDPVTGSYFVLEMIEILESSETNDGYITYNWPKEVGGEPMEKTSYIFYNEEVDLFIGTGLYIDDYKDDVINELVVRIEDYYEQKSDHFFIVSNDAYIYTHSHEEYSREDILELKDVNGNFLHDQIVSILEESPSLWINFYEENEDGEQVENYSYVERIQDWNMYIGQAIDSSELDVLNEEYIDDAFESLAITVLIQIIMISSLILVIHKYMSMNFKDVETEFSEQSDEIKKASMIDSLTKLHNRKYFDTVLSKIELEEDKDYHIIMGDANGLKLTNDAYGHDFGDILLEAISRLLEEVFDTAYIFRWGGDEFLVLAPLNEEEVNEHINQFYKKAEESDIGKVTISISFGYAKWMKAEDPFICINSAEKMMYQNKTFESASTKRAIVDNILESLYGSYNFEKLHSNNVMEFSLLIAEQLDLNKLETNRLRLGSLMHDIGKIGIPDNIMTKTSSLTDDEYEEIKQHPEKGFRILSAYPELSEYGYIVLHHHERFDGKGYPKGLKGEEIPLYSRIITIADAYDAMTGERTYKKSMTKIQAIEELEKCAGTQFDPVLVRIFVRKLKEKV